ncbi:Na/Pi symporter [Marinoscillum sp. MHG1-6]|uniref:Na/Pi symporter n=1 Tax=Marinoscillum sp. MHG1-6 TaxID=2959627 RepID=UPI002157F1E0|nr:Na/Pi symporter [Marinoscillum sp. MHG1-6]
MTTTKTTYGQILILIGIIVAFFVSIQLLGVSFSYLGKDIISTINLATANPYIGLFIGLLTTAILQSSSTTTSLAVAAVASGSLTLPNAIPIVMGANIGTTLTSTIVSMSYITKAAEFKKALSAGVSHDIFNILVALILFPLEIKYGFLTQLSQQMTSLISVNQSGKGLTTYLFGLSFISSLLEKLVGLIGPFVSVVLAIILLFGTVKAISSILYTKMVGETQDQFKMVVFNNTFRSFGWGILLTSIIQSSSLTTSLIVPLVATNKVKLKRAFQFVLGANLGTTITALLAAIFKSESAISLAFAHFLFNAIGVLLFLAIPYLSSIPTFLAKKLGSLTLRYRIAGFAYIIIIFFLLPFTLIYFSTKKNALTVKNPQIELAEDKKQ